MDREEVIRRLGHEPFVPLEIHLSDGRTLDVPFQHVAVALTQHLLVFKGVERAGSRSAKGYEALGYHLIARIDEAKPKRRRRKSA